MTGPVKIDIAADLQFSLGCSEIAVALGMSHYETPYQLWERKNQEERPPNRLRWQCG